MALINIFVSIPLVAFNIILQWLTGLLSVAASIVILIKKPEHEAELKPETAETKPADPTKFRDFSAAFKSSASKLSKVF